MVGNNNDLNWLFTRKMLMENNVKKKKKIKWKGTRKKEKNKQKLQTIKIGNHLVSNLKQLWID